VIKQHHLKFIVSRSNDLHVLLHPWKTRLLLNPYNIISQIKQSNEYHSLEYSAAVFRAELHALAPDIDAEFSSVPLVAIYKTALCHSPEDYNLNTRRVKTMGPINGVVLTRRPGSTRPVSLVSLKTANWDSCTPRGSRGMEISCI
jgi:hypothetical protein